MTGWGFPASSGGKSQDDTLKVPSLLQSVEFLRRGDQGKKSRRYDWKVLKDVTKVRAFTGTSGYYRRFVKNFSLIAAPLYCLMKKDLLLSGQPSARKLSMSSNEG